MNWDYISGFFDADGSITVSRKNKNQNKTLYISFSNNELSILNEINNFIYDSLKIKGHISKKKIYKSNHSQAYDLKYIGYSAFLVSLKLNSIHSKKLKRINTYKLIQEVTVRNGKYTEDLLLKREKLIDKFFE